MSANGDMFRPGEVVLIYFRNEPAFFARVESIVPDRKKGWWRLTFLALAVPLKKMTWILDNDQVRGAEFTMNSEPLKIERVVAPDEEPPARSPEQSTSPEESSSESGARIVPMFGDDE